MADTQPTAFAVAQNIRRLREKQNITTAELSRRMEARGRPLTPLALRRIEQPVTPDTKLKDGRRVDTDDLVTIALALNVSPITLLMPQAESGEDEVKITGADGAVRATDLWDWLQADRPLGVDVWKDVMANMHFQWLSKPGWKPASLPAEDTFTPEKLRHMADILEGNNGDD